MADSDMLSLAAAITGDVLSGFQIPGGSTLSLVATSVLAKKRKQAAEILMLEVRSGRHGPINFDQHDVDPLIDIILRFTKAVFEGAARENLILLAQVVAGMKKHRALDPDRFRRWSKVIEGLTRDELLVLGFACQTNKDVNAREDPDGFNSKLREKIKKAGFEEGEVEALLTSVGSTGLLSSASAWGGLAFQPTPWLTELGELADLEAAVSRM